MTLLNITMNWNDILIVSVIGMLIVFIALTLLVFAFNLTGNLSKKTAIKRMEKQGVDTKNTATPSDIPASEIAAISMALHLFLNEVHDDESNIITIKQVERRYSPWNSKIYGLTNKLDK